MSIDTKVRQMLDKIFVITHESELSVVLFHTKITKSRTSEILAKCTELHLCPLHAALSPVYLPTSILRVRNLSRIRKSMLFCFGFSVSPIKRNSEGLHSSSSFKKQLLRLHFC
jgi:hypothetical protein